MTVKRRTIRRRAVGRFFAGALLAMGLGAAFAGDLAARSGARLLQSGQGTLGDATVFDYRLVDFDGAARHVVFNLPTALLVRSRAMMHPFDNAAMSRQIEAEMRAFLQRRAPEIQVRFVTTKDRLEVSLSGPDERKLSAVRDELGRVHDQAEAAYLRKELMVLHNGLVFLDYPRLAAIFAPSMQPVARAVAGALERGVDERQRLQLLVALIQTIPYDALRDRDVTNGIDYVTPPVLFQINRGDCDSKAVALAAIGKDLLPGRRFLMVLLPNHAILGIDLPAKGGERTLVHDGRTYVLMEAAGPAALAIGRVYPETETLLRAGRIDHLMLL